MASKSGYDWGDWTTLVDAVAIAHGGDHVSGAVDLNGKIACDVSVAATYTDHAITAGAVNYVLQEIESVGPTYETEDDVPWSSGEMGHLQNSTRYDKFSVDPSRIGRFKVLTTYDGLAGSGVTVTVRYRTATLKTE